MKAKKILALVLALMLVFVLAACGSSSDNSDNKETTNEDGTVQITVKCADREDPGNYGPYGFNSNRFMYQSLLFEPMLFKNSDGELEKVLLKDYESLGDGVYQLTLYDYIHDTEGNPLTSSDVVFSFEKAIENGTYSSVLSSFDGFDVIDEYTLNMKLVDERAGTFESICCAINIITEAAWESAGDEMVHNAVGTTPYRLTDYVEGSYVTYEKTNDYWQTDESLLTTKGQANADVIQWVVVEDNSAGAVALQTGEVDFIKAADAVDYELFMNDDMTPKEGYNVSVINSQMTYGITFNCGSSSNVSDVLMRQAICYAIDTEAIAANIFGDYAQAAGNYINPAYADYDASLEDLDDYYRYDVEKAQSLMAEAGYNGETIKILCPSTGQAKNIGPLVQGYLLAAGFEAEVDVYESAIYSSYLYDSNPEWDIAITADQGGTGCEYMWSVLYQCDNTLNDFGCLLHVDDSTLQQKYEAMASASTNSSETLGDFLNYVNENCYMYDIMNFYKFTFSSSRFETLVTNSLGDLVAGACVVSAE